MLLPTAMSPLDVYAALRGPGGQALCDRVWRHLHATGFVRVPTQPEVIVDVASAPISRADTARAYSLWSPAPWLNEKASHILNPLALGVVSALPQNESYAGLPAHIPYAMANMVRALDFPEKGMRTYMRCGLLQPFWLGWFASLAYLVTTRPTFARADIAPPTLASATAGMPLLGKVVEWARERWQPSFANLEMAAQQHLIPDVADVPIADDAPACTNEQLFNVMETLGLQRQRAHILGKHYSAGPHVVEAMQRRGWDVDPLSLALIEPVTTAFDELAGDVASAAMAAASYRHLKNMFKDVDPKTCNRRFLILDDGGALIRALHEDPSPWGESLRKFAPLCTCVEQTTSGLAAIADIKLECPVVSVASSGPKTQLEAPIIGASAYEGIKDELTPEQWQGVRRVVVSGFGTVGSSVARAFRDGGSSVAIDDIQPTALKRAESDDFIVHWNNAGGSDRRAAFGEANLLVVASNSAINEAAAQWLPNGAIVANLSSGQNGFKAAGNDMPFHGLGGTWFGKPDRTIAADNDNGWYRILHSGFVVNMRREVPRRFIQLTRAVVLGGCMQALRETKPGIIPLDPELASFITDEYVADVKAHGLDPMKPDFEKARRG